MRNTIEDPEKLADKLEDEDLETIKEALAEHQEWVDENLENDEADKEEYEEHLKDLQAVCDPIVAQFYDQQGGQGGDEEDEEDYDDL
jgi:heat shock protein 5